MRAFAKEDADHCLVMSETPRHPRFRVLPPTLLIIFLPLMFIHRAFSQEAFLPWPERAAFLLFSVFGVGIAVSARRQFARVDTNVHTFREPDRLVEEGVFSWTRNPMYLGLSWIALGVALATGTWCAVALAMLYGLICHFYYIPFEEAWMQQKFGADYAAYARRVRRWYGRSSRAVGG